MITPLNLPGERIWKLNIASGVMLAVLGAVSLNTAYGQAASATATAAVPTEARMPTLFLAGDSTMHPGGVAVMGWADALPQFFDTSKIKIENHALAGRSSRSFIEDARGWPTIKPHLQKGDFVFIEFGHNDDEGMALNVLRFRFTLPGTGDEAGVFEVLPGTQTGGGAVIVPGQKVTIHTFGYYLRQMISEVQAAGATPIVLSPVPRNAWDNGKIIRGEEHHGPWAKDVADQMKVPFVDINELIAKMYDPLGEEKVKELFFTNQDNTHTSPNGARVSAACGVLGLLALKDCPINAYLLPDAGAKAKEIVDTAPTTVPVPAPPRGRMAGAGQ